MTQAQERVGNGDTVAGGQSAIRLPQSLVLDDYGAALKDLRTYFGSTYQGDGCLTGAYFDTWQSTDCKQQADAFTADDLISVTFLSVDIPARAAREILATHATELNDMLRAIGVDKHLAEVEAPFTHKSHAWALETRLRKIPGIAQTKASKLIARKRPKLYPIYDTVVGKVLGTQKAHIEPIRQALRVDNASLHQRLTHLRDEAELPEHISPVRVLDVLAWLEGKGRSSLQRID